MSLTRPFTPIPAKSSARHAFLTSVLGFALALVLPGPASAQKRAVPWRWSRAPNHYPKVDLRARIRHVHYVLREFPAPRRGRALPGTWAELREELRKGGVSSVVWRTRINDRQHLVGAAMVVSGGRIFIARYSRISTTCTLYAFSTRNGRRLWKVNLRGYGPVAHSKWFNRVQAWTHRGNPVVFGHEGPGTSYIEVRRATNGTLLSHRKFSMRLPPAPLAEALYDEVHRVLSRQPRYRRTVAAFIQGHVLRIPSPGQALARFRRAVRQIDGLPLLRNRYTLKVRLRRQPSGAYVILARRR